MGCKRCTYVAFLSHSCGNGSGVKNTFKVAERLVFYPFFQLERGRTEEKINSELDDCIPGLSIGLLSGRKSRSSASAFGLTSRLDRVVATSTLARSLLFPFPCPLVV